MVEKVTYKNDRWTVLQRRSVPKKDIGDQICIGRGWPEHWDRKSNKIAEILWVSEKDLG
jgi:hypothetical protein